MESARPSHRSRPGAVHSCGFRLVSHPCGVPLVDGEGIVARIRICAVGRAGYPDIIVASHGLFRRNFPVVVSGGDACLGSNRIYQFASLQELYLHVCTRVSRIAP